GGGVEDVHAGDDAGGDLEPFEAVGAARRLAQADGVLGSCAAAGSLWLVAPARRSRKSAQPRAPIGAPLQRP
ncbi:hypothetical protein, partial [Streptomyces ureilyticus]|uniref:hypothetical protein n=1 Tax=Streptomyces ureilyticus TaxID=1775131 RepID=UPI0019D2AC6E